MIILCFILSGEVELTKKIASEPYFQAVHAQTEYVTVDGSRVDILTDIESIEVDWACKWAEAIGQATLYSILTDRKPAVLLLTKNKQEDMKYIFRCLLCCTRLGYKFYLREVTSE